MKYTKIHILFCCFRLGKYSTGVRFPRAPWQNDCIRHVSQPQWKIRTKNGHDSQQLLIQLKSNRHLISSTSLFCTDLHNQWSDCNRNWCGFSLSSYLMSLQKEFLVLDKSSWSWCKLHESWSLVYGAPLKWTCSTMVSTLGPHLQGRHPPPSFKGFITGPYLIGFETSGVNSDLPCGELGSEVCKLVVTSFTHSGPNDYNRRCSVIYISNKSDSRHYITFGLQSCHLSREKTGFERLEVGRSVGFPECMPWHFRTWNFWSSAPIAAENSAKWSSENTDGGYDKGSWPFDVLVKWEEWKW